LFELATDGPGFATDEDPARLGKRLALPPFLESRRAAIEAKLKPLNDEFRVPANPSERSKNAENPNAEPTTLMIPNQEIDLWVSAGRATGPYEH